MTLRKIIIPSSYITNDSHISAEKEYNEMVNWLEENVADYKNNVAYSRSLFYNYFYFKNESDALLFKLIWHKHR